MTSFSTCFFKNISEIVGLIDIKMVEQITDELLALRNRNGRLFFLGVGGSAANCSHAVNDFRKLCGIETYTPTDNVSEITARTNDDGWSSTFSAWLQVSRANENDAVFILSVGGGNRENNVSPNLISALDESKKRGLTILGIVGRNGGYTKQIGDFVLTIPMVDPEYVTAHAESFQSLVLHCIAFHPKLKCCASKWESLIQVTAAK
ncbi:MAG: sugar isomerase [Chlamydiae bacterium CG10_big_fil_rev_8_21_14_0_10_35_9]|nr:MAG: sugar isomerase [Chlamydiae bacterium CG10_big_fil_rev_8_21_14_0_10_35_9]